MSLPSALLLLLAAAQQPDTAAAAARADGPRTPYWQQEVSYDITARLDERAGVLAGGERIAYRNRSPDTLQTFALHLYLNAFRPGSRWADADSAEQRRRFNDLKDPDFAFNHVRRVHIMGQEVEPTYPFAPDSTIVRFALPRPLAPGDSMSVEMDWDARPSTTPRRQGRQGRRFDFAQWYPKVVVYDRYGWEEHPVYPGGEFYGEFAAFRVRLDVPEDQVVGSTGVPLCGDPGWERANRLPGTPVDYQRDFYGAAVAQAADCAGAEAGYKRLVWYARDVHHFAMSLNPQYRYEGGRYRDVAVHVLYQPGDEQSWGGGVAVKRTEIALGWLDSLYGKFAWPQLTNVHRIEGGGTEFPMMIHDGSADQGLIVHELGHNYTMGILANNEWREGFLDEGFTSFQTDWFWETHGRPGGYENTEAGMLDLELDDYAEPTSLVSESYRDFVTYNIMIYNRGALFFHQLRYIVGDDVMRRILRTYYDRWRLKHVDEEKFREVAEEVSRRDLKPFFAQWLHSVDLYDYAIGRVQRARLENGRWRTRVEVVRKGPGRIPVEVAALAHDTALVRAEGLAEREWVELVTEGKPREILLDPRVRSHDWNFLNNRKTFGFNPIRTLVPQPGTELYLHPYFETRSARDHYTLGVQPLVWYNDAGGLTLGLRTRDDYLGRFEQNQLWLTGSTGLANPDGETDVKKGDLFLRARNPVWLRAPNLSETFDAFRMEGRMGALASVDWQRRPHLAFGPTYQLGAALQWVRTDDERYLDPGFYEPGGTVEATLSGGVANRTAKWQVALDGAVGGGISYGRATGLSAPTSRTELYLRPTLAATARRSLGKRLSLGLRGYAAAALDEQSVLRQRRIYVAGADPYASLYNPFYRSRGALLVQDDVNYQVPGGLGLRGFDPHLSAIWGTSASAELEYAVVQRPRAGLFNRVALAAFGDLGVTDLPAVLDPADAEVLWDAGVGLRMDHRIMRTRFTTRFDLPLAVSRPTLAQDVSTAADKRVRFRWLFSFQPAF